MSFSKTISFLCLCFLLTSCGFRPLYSPYGCNSDIVYPIKIAKIPERNGQVLRNLLVDLLTPGGEAIKPQYVLEIKLTEVIKAIGVNKDETTSRKTAVLTAGMTLKDSKTNKILYTHSVNAINSFEVISENYYADVVAEDYAKEEALRLLAEKIRLTLSTYLDSRHEN
jgi:LPS-assembly lipoprotein